MAALEPHYMTILKKVLTDRFVRFLPPPLNAKQPLSAEQSAKQLSRAFSAFALNKLLDITPQAAAASVVDDVDDKGIDAIYYEEKTETLYLLQSKLKVSEQFKQEDALPFCEGVRLLLNQDFSGFNANVQNRKADIESALDSCSYVKLVVPYTGDGVSKTACDALQGLLNDENLNEERLATQVEYYAAADITRDLLAEQAYKPVHADIELYKYQKMEEPHTTYYGVIRLSDLVKLHETHGKALYERNIRYFLGSSKSDVNRAIKATLLDKPEDFFYLNNGVTAVCDLIEPKGKKNDTKKFKLRGLSIINGAQTVASAAEFVSQHSTKNINKAKVMFTLIKAKAEDQFGKEVTKARNHQNPVQAANFASLDDNQERLRQEIASLGFGYYYRPEVDISQGGLSFHLKDAIIALSLTLKNPRAIAYLKNDLQKLTDVNSTLYNQIFSKDTLGVHVVNAVFCYREVRTILQAAEKQATAGSQERMIYRHGIYAIAAIMMARLRDRINKPNVMNPNDIRQLISQPLDQLRQEAFDLAKDHLKFEGPLAYFRNRGYVTSYLADLMEKHYELTDNPEVGKLRNIQTAEDANTYPRKRLIDFLSTHAPQL